MSYTTPVDHKVVALIRDNFLRRYSLSLVLTDNEIWDIRERIWEDVDIGQRSAALYAALRIRIK